MAFSTEGAVAPGQTPDNPITLAVPDVLDDWGYLYVRCGHCRQVDRCTPERDFYQEPSSTTGELFHEHCLMLRNPPTNLAGEG